MATPLAGAGVGAVACSSEGASDFPLDATIREGSAPVSDAGAADHDAGDATIGATGSTDATTRPDREGCGSAPLESSTDADDTQDGCVAFGRLPCGLPPTAQLEGCLIDLATCIPLCDGLDASFFLTCQLGPASCNEAGTVLVDAESLFNCSKCQGISGRRPLGLCPIRLTKRTPVGDYFASMAHLESASVRAFRDLERWLVAFGAPRRLSRAARRFAGDERLHARAATRLARRFGGVPVRPRIRRTPTPTLVALLEDDAIEGCVKETFGALLATWQAERAGDARVRRALRRIAADETRHAALAWEILAWGLSRLPTRDRLRVEETLVRAAVALKSEGPLHPAVRLVVGHPEPEHEGRLVAELALLVDKERRAVMRERPWGVARFG